MILEVIVDISNAEVDRTFDYLGDDMPLGSRVSVEFGRKKLIGFVIGKKEKSEFENLKSAVLIDTPIDEKQLALMDFMRETYNLRHIDVLRLFIPAKLREEKNPQSEKLYLSVKPEIPFEEAAAAVGGRAVKQLEVLNYLYEVGGCYRYKLIKRFGDSAVNSLRAKELVDEKLIHEANVPLTSLGGRQKSVILTAAQQNAVNEIINSEKPQTFLIHGVTGSGKTEVYETVIEEMLKRGKTAIMLVPEISLTPQVLGLFRARFGDNVALLHSGLNASERYDEWKRLRDGEAKIALGARSAIFAPLENIGVIIIDEEHDASYQSESNPRYDTKKIAGYRAEISGASLVLGSATPDCETYLNAVDGRYKLVNMPDRISSYPLPQMEIVDMVQEFRHGNRGLFSYALTDAVKTALERKEQIMLFLNRRGFASFVQCKKCGYIAKCEDCDISLTYHKEDNQLKCHYCGKRYHMLTKCPVCGNTEIKQGRVGTEKVVEELKKLFPEARVLRMDNDTTSQKDSYFKILDKFAKKEADVLVGTQMIAKGHDFAGVTLVGILEADAALYFSDYRSAERTFQLITQVAGRAGRADKKGRVILQTYAPSHYVFRFGQNYDYYGFWKKEINTRTVTKFPPYTKIVRVLISSEDETVAVGMAREIYKDIQKLQSEKGAFVYLGAAKSPVARMKNMSRYQVLMRLEPDMFDGVIKGIYKIAEIHKQKKGNCFVEINPQSLI